MDYPEYPGPQEAEEGVTYAYSVDGGKVAATVRSVESEEDGSVSVSLTYSVEGS